MRIRIIAAVCLLSVACSGQKGRGIVYKTDFTNTFSYGSDSRHAADDASVSRVLLGKKEAIRFVLNRGQSRSPERSELMFGSNTGTRRPFSDTNREVWFGTSIFLPATLKTDADTTSPIVFQWHDLDTTKSSRVPMQSMKIERDRWIYTIRYLLDAAATTNSGIREKRYDLGSVHKNRFTDWVVNIRWSAGLPDGYVNIWKNGKKVVAYKGGTCYNDPNGFLPYLKFGIYNYRWKSIPDSFPTVTNRICVYQADVRYGYSKAGLSTVAPDNRSFRLGKVVPE